MRFLKGTGDVERTQRVCFVGLFLVQKKKLGNYYIFKNVYGQFSPN